MGNPFLEELLLHSIDIANRIFLVCVCERDKDTAKLLLEKNLLFQSIEIASKKKKKKKEGLGEGEREKNYWKNFCYTAFT